MDNATKSPSQIAIKKRVAEILLEIGAVAAQPEKPYVLTSGTYSPVYIDCRKLISFVPQRKEVIDYLATIVNRRVGETIQGIAGGETAGIPYAAFLSWKLNLPMLYVRKKPKGFGKNAQVEGEIPPNSRVILVEDLIFDGGSKVNFIQGLRNAGYQVNHVFTVASYALVSEYENSLGSLGVSVDWLTDWPTIVDVGQNTGCFSNETAQVIREFLQDPHAWSQARGGK